MFRPFALCLSAFPFLTLHSPAAEGSNTIDSAPEPAPLVAPDAGRLAPGASALFTVAVPERNERELKAEADWRGVASVDLYGTLGEGKAEVAIEAVDTESGEVLGSGTAITDAQPELAPWAVVYSSAQARWPAAGAFSHQPRQEWFAEQEVGREEWTGILFGNPTRMTGLRYVPSGYRRASGVARKYRIDILQPGSNEWETLLSGERKKDPWTPMEVPFPEPVEVGGFRFVVETDWIGVGGGSAARIDLPGVELPTVPRAVAPARAWIEISPEATMRLEDKSFSLRARNPSEHPVAIGKPRFARVNLAPDGNLLGRPTRTNGPDKIGAGLLGFDALTEHNRTVLSLMTVRPDSAGGHELQHGDVIVAVAGQPLPVNNLAAGWDWFHYSHEAVMGRAQETALKAGEKTLAITVIRDGKPKEIAIPLNREAAFTTLNPLDDPEAARMLDDCLAFLTRTQREDGSWSRCMIRTSFSALAMLATGKEEHIERAGRAVEWAKNRYKEPANYGNLGFWHGAYAGILYSEWHLATGDTSVMPNLEALRDWVIGGQKDSAFGIPALGHGTGGLPYKNRGLVAPACHLLVYEAIAMRGGMESGIWELILPYMELAWSNPADGGHGALGYHRDHKDQNEFWSRSGLFAMAAHLRGERHDMRDAMIHIMHERHPWLRNSHAYGEPGGALGLLALNLVSPEIYAEVMGHYAWWFSLAWEPGYGLRFTTPHKGAPYMGEETIINAAYALVLQGPRRSLHLTGKPQ